MGNTYAWSDIHGNKKLFDKVMNYLKPDDKVYFLGDAVDRGEGGWSILCSLLRDKRFTYLKGNHEDMMFKAYKTLDKELNYRNSHELALWFYNGGAATYNKMIDTSTPEEVESIMKIVKDLPLEVTYINANKEIIHMTHSGAMFEDESLYDNIEEEILWNRDHFFSKWGFPENEYLIHGHTPVIYLIDELIELYNFKDLPIDKLNEIEADEPLVYCDGHKIDIDCGAHFQNSTALINLDTFEIIIFKGDN